MSEISLININKTYGNTVALEDINLKFEENKIYGLFGRNGAGKTTMLNIIANRIFASSGEVLFDGKHIKENDELLSKIYIMGEKLYYSGGEKAKNIFKQTTKFYPNFNIEKAFDLSKEFGLDTNKAIGKLSTGYQTVFKDIIALCVNTPFVFFDEPVLGLDAHHRELFYKRLVEIYMENQSTFVVSTHLIDEISSLIEKVVIIDNKMVFEPCDCDDLKARSYVVTGKADLVGSFSKKYNVVGTEDVGNIKAAYILYDIDQNNIPAELEVSKADLQKIFIKLTNKEV